MQALSKSQQKLVSENHNLIYSFANQRGINLTEYYDVLAIGLCKAAIIYDENKYKFSTLAYTAMNNEYRQELRKLTASKTIPQDKIVPIDAKVKSDKGDVFTSVVNTIPDDSVCVEDTALNNVMHYSLDHRLRNDERQILSMLMDGMSQSEIAQKMNISRQWISVKIKRIRNLLS